MNSATHQMSDLELLRGYEPVVRYTQGEMFFPCAVDGYLRQCTLWMADPERKSILLADRGTLTTTTLAGFRNAPLDHRLYLRFIDHPIQALEYQQWLRQPYRPKFRHPNRLYRVGLVTRILDALFDLALLLRGRVPGGTAAAAQQLYVRMPLEERQPTYYGRVIRSGGYIALHYIYFFVMNDWRSSFHGVNDHESDWEQVFVYLTDEASGAPPTPRWIACASHDFRGDDLRRRWDDAEVEKVEETHPVIYAGAGSHGSYFARGEYLMQEEPGFLKPLHGISAVIERFWRTTLRQGTPLNLDAGIRSLLSIPFVDYARGDGRSIGVGGDAEWSVIEIGEDDAWVHNYRGLWGLDTWDPLAGERAPSGPKYERDGSVRLSWSNPLAWAGLDKVPPPQQALAEMEQLLGGLADEDRALNPQMEAQRNVVRKLQLEVQSLRRSAFLTNLYKRRMAELVETEEKLASLRARHNDLLESQEAGQAMLLQMRAGNFGGPRDHLQHAHHPQPPIAKINPFARWWAAVSGGFILLSILPIIYFRPPSWPWLLIGVVTLFGGVDAATRGRLSTFLLRLTILLALLNSAILLYRFWWVALLLGFSLVVIVSVRDNLRELSDG